MSSRYNDGRPFINDNPFYEEFFQERDIKQIRQFRTKPLRHPTVDERASLHSIQHVWKVGDRLSKLAQKHYNDPTLWWVIAWYNKRPTEAHYKTGTVVYIPTPLNKVLAILRRI